MVRKAITLRFGMIELDMLIHQEAGANGEVRGPIVDGDRLKAQPLFDHSPQPFSEAA
jgi:hypothetical protein